jgi:cytochrome P450
MSVVETHDWTTAGSIDDVLADDRVLTDPYPVYRRLHREAPVHWAAAWRSWVVSTYDGVATILRDPRWSTSQGSRGRMGWNVQHLEAGQRAKLDPIMSHYRAGMLSADPPDHTRIKGIVKHDFTPQSLERRATEIRGIADDLLARVYGSSEVDIIAAFAYPLPSVVVHDVLGLPRDDIDTITGWAEDIIAVLDSNRPDFDVCLRAQESLADARRYIRELLERRRRFPQDDVLTHFALAHDSISDAEVVGTCATFLTGGHETTTALIGNGVLRLLQDPPLYRALADDRALLPSAIEEFLRIESPAQRVTRFARVSLTLGGVNIEPETPVIALIGAANRDSTVFDRPDDLNLQRQPNRHLAFAAGVHSCIGAPLARLEARVAFTALLDAVESMELAEPKPDWLPIHAVRFQRRLPVRVKWRRRSP